MKVIVLIVIALSLIGGLAYFGLNIGNKDQSKCQAEFEHVSQLINSVEQSSGLQTSTECHDYIQQKLNQLNK